MKYPNKQSGFALLTLMGLISVGLLFNLSTRLQPALQTVELDGVLQSQQALAEAKTALLGFAANYDLDNVGQLPGYLPCPDTNGNGSANPPCSSAGNSVMGCLPWRTLGLPHLKDGSGSDLWYAVSGSYKNNPKQALSNHSNGLFVIENVYGQAEDGSDAVDGRAIAVVFAPGKALAGQSRPYPPDCGNASLYLESLNNVSNATGEKIGASGSAPGISALPNNVGSVFVNAAPTWANSPRQLTFNDQLVWISPDDYAPIYTEMALWVNNKIATCLNNYSQQVIDNITAANAAAQSAWDDWQDNLEERCQDSILGNGNHTGWCKPGHHYYENWLATQTPPSPPTPISTNIHHYPWLSPFDGTQAPVYDDGVNLRFGRIPSVLDDSVSSNAFMPATWEADPTAATACFNVNTSGLDDGEWGWWSAWREHTFLAIHKDNTPDASTEFDPSAVPDLNPDGTPVPLSLEENVNLMEWVLTIAGRESPDQSRQTNADKADFENYFHCNNNIGAGTYILEGQSTICGYSNPSAADIEYCNNYTEYFKLPVFSGQTACRIGGDTLCGRCQTTGAVICGDQHC